MIEIPRTAGDFAKRERGGYKVRLLGLGGAGLNIMSRVASEGGDAKLMTVLDTDVRALKSSRAAVRLQLGSDVTHGMGCGGDPDLGRESAEMSEAQIREILRGSDLVFLCVGLGGGTGSGAAPMIARVAKEEGCFVIAAVTLPFHFEGRRRQQQALDSLTELRRSAGALLTFENDRMGDLIVPSSGVQEAFAAADRMISQSVRAITVLLDKPGMIRVTLEDLLSFLNGKDAKCNFGFGEAEGGGRAEKATAEALAHHLKEPAGLAEASSVLIHLAGDNSVTFAEVEHVAAAVSAKVHPECKVLLGVSASQELEKKLSVAIITSVDQARRMSRPDMEPRGQELQVTPLVDLPPLIRQAPMAAPVRMPSPMPVPMANPAPAAGGLFGGEGRTGGLPPVAAQPFEPGKGLPVQPAVSPLMAGPAPMAPAPVSLGQSLPPPPPMAPLPPSGPRQVPFAVPPAPGPAMPKEPLPPMSPPTSEQVFRGLPVSPVSAAPTGEAPEAPRPIRTPGALGDPLDYPASKGRFEGTEPTKVSGVDLDWPTFLRKKRAQG